MQPLACQLSSIACSNFTGTLELYKLMQTRFLTLCQFSFDQNMRVEKTFIQTLTCQLSSTLMQLLFSFDQDMRVEKTHTNSDLLTFVQLLFSFKQDKLRKSCLNFISLFNSHATLVLTQHALLVDFFHCIQTNGQSL